MSLVDPMSSLPAFEHARRLLCTTMTRAELDRAEGAPIAQYDRGGLTIAADR